MPELHAADRVSPRASATTSRITCAGRRRPWTRRRRRAGTRSWTTPPPSQLEVGARAGGDAALGARRQAALPELLELLAGLHLLREQRRLDPVEQPLEPPDQLGLGDAELGLGGH